MEANREYKDTLFSKLFSKPYNLIELYNAIANTDYSKDTKIEINTLEDVFFKDLKNDVSFTIDDKFVVLLEHQSTINANMPLRCLMYIARVFEKITDERAIYQEKLLRIPTPEFIILYNGEKPFPTDITLNLSDAYKGAIKSGEKLGYMDLTVRVININKGQNDELVQKSETLYDYTAFVERVRQNQRSGYILHDAIKEAITWGISQDVLGTYLTEHGSEVTSMLMTEFNIDIAKEVWQEEAREDGYEEGFEEGVSKAREELKEELTTKDKIIATKDKEIARLITRIEQLNSNDK